MVWDLTGGFFLALGFDPLIANKDYGTGLYNLIRLNPRAAAALDKLIAAVLSNLEVSWTGAFLAFEVLLWNENLGWPILRFVFAHLGWMVLAKVLVKILEWTQLFAVAVAEAIVSFAIWGYNTTMDVIAYINLGAKTTLALPSLATE